MLLIIEAGGGVASRPAGGGITWPLLAWLTNGFQSASWPLCVTQVANTCPLLLLVVTFNPLPLLLFGFLLLFLFLFLFLQPSSAKQKKKKEIQYLSSRWVMRLYGGMVSSLLIRQRRRRHWRLRHNPVFFSFFLSLFIFIRCGSS